MQDFPLSYIEEENGKLVGKGVAFKVLEFLTEKFNFSINIVKLEKDIIGSQTEYKGSLVECLNESVCTFRRKFIKISNKFCLITFDRKYFIS